MTKVTLLFALAVIFVSQPYASEHSLSAMRTTFLQAEKYIIAQRDDDYFKLAEALKNYPLYPYLHYQWLAKHLDDNAAVLSYLHSYPRTRYAPLLHRKWLAHLGSKQAWLEFIRQYVPSGDSQLQCYFARAQYQTGHISEAMTSAKSLWRSGKPLPTACDPLLEWLKSSSKFSQSLVWDRFQAALQQNQTRLANDTMSLMSKSNRQTAQLWLKLHKQPQLVKSATILEHPNLKSGLLFSHAIKRWLENDPYAALQAWDKDKNRFDIPHELTADIEKRLGMALAFNRDSQAYDRLSQFAGNDPAAQEWRVRAALNQQNWQNVLKAVNAMDEELKRQEKWQYWRARALQATKQYDDATKAFQSLAEQRSFYAFMAAHRLHREIALNHHAVAINSKELKELANRDEFLMVSELLNIGRRNEASLQWWHAISELDSHQLAVAAKLAQNKLWPSMAIFTLAKAKYWDDMELRFPIIFNREIRQQANQQGLEASFILGLIRQESAFDEYAGSSAGAMGLMQIMPNTARQLARELKERWHNDFNLLLPPVNIKYGSYYFKKLLRRYDGHYALAIAAYNAGPGRVKRWLPEKHALPADIWIETIPYKETRAYVASVLMHALIYQNRLEKKAINLLDLLPEVRPKQN